MRETKFKYARNNPSHYTFNCRVWMPDNCDPTAVLLVLHGMTEHIGRYEKLASFLTDYGIAVAGFDLRGHGFNASNTKCASFASGKSDNDYGWSAAVEDFSRFSVLMKEQFPNAKQFALGFSLGSFILRDYMIHYPCDHLSGVILMGTGDQPGWILKIMKVIVKGQISKCGMENTTDLVKKLSFDTYNAKFSPVSSRADWLTSNDTERFHYLQDSLCRPDISADLFYDLLDAMDRTGKVRNFQFNQAMLEMPVLLMSGAEDPVGNMGKGVLSFHKKLEEAGMENVKAIYYHGGRHDILHEIDIISDIVPCHIRDFIFPKSSNLDLNHHESS